MFVTHQQAIVRYARRRLQEDAVEDVVSSVFTQAWKHRDKVPESEPLPWLYAAARFEVLRLRRTYARVNRVQTKVNGLAESTGVEADSTDNVSLNLDVESMLSQLSEKDAEVLRLSAWEQLSLKEIATVMGCPLTTARMRLHHARRRAKKLWQTAQ